MLYKSRQGPAIYLSKGEDLYSGPGPCFCGHSFPVTRKQRRFDPSKAPCKRCPRARERVRGRKSETCHVLDTRAVGFGREACREMRRGRVHGQQKGRVGHGRAAHRSAASKQSAKSGHTDDVKDMAKADGLDDGL
ncbi:hypothetical protein XA68_11623 [Ophiocordyceps unilateralis]|uniref:Uncharacterized protein n=1 Tax=Ophiocordyceps unilateralis TaxID=268505 RepID=A0A2A9PPN9_OPHUN|nr:hypothetical protein XA68_11623 [Ophiocordyceps unilateralis]